MKSLCVFGVGDFAGSSAWKGLTFPTLCTISLACFNILTFCSVSSCRPLSNKIGFTRFGASTQKLFSFRVLLFFSYRKYRPIGRYYRSELPEVLPEPSTAYESWVLDSNGSSTGTTAKPEVPVLPAVLPPGTSGDTSEAQCRLRKLGTGLNGSGTES